MKLLKRIFTNSQSANHSPWLRSEKTHVAFFFSQKRLDSFPVVNLNGNSFYVFSQKPSAHHGHAYERGVIQQEDGSLKHIDYTRMYEFNPSQINDDGSLSIPEIETDAVLIWDGPKNDVLYSGKHSNCPDFSSDRKATADKTLWNRLGIGFN